MAETSLQGIWTQKGLDKETAFRAGGTRKALTHVAVGDGNGTIPLVSASQTGLVHEVWRGLANAVMANPDDPTDLLVDVVIPNNVGGFWIREWGIFDEDGDLVAVGPHDEMHKPLISTGQSAEFLERFHLPSANAGFVEIKIASQALATQQYVESKLDAHNKDTGAHAALARKSVRLVAGAGMAGGGTLAGDVTFAAKLTDSVTTTDSGTAASATAVKAAYDAAEGKLPLSGGTITGGIAIKDTANAIETAPPASTERGVFLTDKNGNIMGGFDVIQRASDNAKWTQIFAKNSKGQFTTLSIDIGEDGVGEVNSTSPVQINDMRISRVFDNGVRLLSLSGARGNEGLPLRYSPDNGELYLDGRAVHGKADYAAHADTAQSAYGLSGMEMIIWKETFTLPGYGTWKYMYWASSDGAGGDMVIGEDPGGTVLRYPTPGKFMDGIAFRSA